MKNKKLAILIVAFNKSSILDICLKQLNKSVGKELFDVFVIDNGSKEDILSVAKKYHTYYIYKQKNYFISRALNEAFFDLKIANKYKYVLFMANDVFLDPKACREMLKTMEKNPTIGVTGPEHYEWNSNIVRSRGLSIHPITSLLLNYLNHSQKINHFHSIYMVRTDVFKQVKGFNYVLFPMIFEEPDLGQRILLRHYKIRYSKKAKIWHPIETSAEKLINGKILIRQERLYSNIPKIYLFFRNRIIYMSLYSNLIQFLIFYFIFYPLIFIYYLLDIPFSNWRYALMGWFDGTVFSLSKKQNYIKKRNKEVLGI